MADRKKIFHFHKKYLIFLLIFGLSIGLYAQSSSFPLASFNVQSGTQMEQVGGQAHIGGGILILLVLGLVYTSKRIYDKRKKE